MSSKFLPRFQVAFSSLNKFNVLSNQSRNCKWVDAYRLIVSNERPVKSADVQEFIGKQIPCLSMEEHDAIVAGLEEKLDLATKALKKISKDRVVYLSGECRKDLLTWAAELAVQTLAKLKGESD